MYSRAEGIADHYWPWAVFSSSLPPRGHCLIALPHTLCPSRDLPLSCPHSHSIVLSHTCSLTPSLSYTLLLVHPPLLLVHPPLPPTLSSSLFSSSSPFFSSTTHRRKASSEDRAKAPWRSKQSGCLSLKILHEF